MSFFKNTRRSLSITLTAATFVLASTVVVANCGIQCTQAAAGAKQAAIQAIPAAVQAGCSYANARGDMREFNSCSSSISQQMNTDASNLADNVYKACMSSCQVSGSSSSAGN